jgi:hypothetical protein
MRMVQRLPPLPLRLPLLLLVLLLKPLRTPLQYAHW